MPPFTQLDIATNRFVARSTFRHLLRATGIAFKEDPEMLRAAREHARREFRRDLRADSIEAAQGIEHAQGVTKILRENLVQGKLVGDDKYKLRIHEHTQRLDNDVAPSLKGTTKSFGEVKRNSLMGEGEIRTCGARS